MDTTKLSGKGLVQPSAEESQKMSAKELKDVFWAKVIAECLIYRYRIYLEGQEAEVCKRLEADGFHNTPDGDAFRQNYNDMLVKVRGTLYEWDHDYDRD
ncbi:MAG: hypothetical protein L6R37_007876 [Teloschistes peruensis]|nr:MAG: hypothetical protein L6R37_007876 [Teloschistes peruensis]